MMVKIDDDDRDAALYVFMYDSKVPLDPIGNAEGA